MESENTLEAKSTISERILKFGLHNICMYMWWRKLKHKARGYFKKLTVKYYKVNQGMELSKSYQW
jgi:hypothetical protein